LISRFLEVQDEYHTNLGRFLVQRFDSKELRFTSSVTGEPLLATLPLMRRFGARINATTLLLTDLATQEGLLFDPEQSEEALRRRFLAHPLHVCILFYPLMRFLAKRRAAIWKLPNLVTLSLEEMLEQPGVLLDKDGRPVTTTFEWSRRPGLAARLRNEELPPEVEDGEGGSP
jgi:hypothetical protein